MKWRVKVKKYLIAMSNDQMGYETRYNEYDIIEAECGEEALKLYNKAHNYTYFFGCIMAIKTNDNINVCNRHMTYEHLEYLRNS